MKLREITLATGYLVIGLGVGAALANEPGSFCSGTCDDVGEKSGWSSTYGGDPDGGAESGPNDGWDAPRGLSVSAGNGRADNGAGNGGESGGTGPNKYGEDGFAGQGDLDPNS